MERDLAVHEYEVTWQTAPGRSVAWLESGTVGASFNELVSGLDPGA